MTVDTPLAPRQQATMHAPAPLAAQPAPVAQPAATPRPAPTALLTRPAVSPHAGQAASPHAGSATSPVARPAHAPTPARPRLVRATAPANGFPVEALIQHGPTPSSILDVDPRLLVVRRTAPAPVAPAHRSLAAPIDERRERQSMLRRRILTTVGGAAAVLVSAASVGLALA